MTERVQRARPGSAALQALVDELAEELGRSDYRLRRIREITGLDLDDGADRLVLHMGLRIEELLATPGEEARV